MAAPTWPAVTVPNYLSGDGAEYTDPAGLKSRDDCAAAKGTTWYLPEAQVTTSYANLASKFIRLPDYAAAGYLLSLRGRVKRAAASGAFTARLRDVASATDGAEVPTTPSTSVWTTFTVTLAVANGAWRRTTREFALRVKRDAVGSDAQWLVSTETMMLNFWIEPVV